MKLALTLIALMLSVTAARAVNTIAWQKSLFDNVPMFTSTGAALDSSFTFQLGTFGSLTPTQANIDQWETNWKLLNVGNWNSGNQAFGNTFTFNPDGTVSGLSGSATFTEGEQAYLWVRSGNEWALVSDISGLDSNDRWMLPSMTNLNAGSFVWELPTADSIVYGGANGIQSGSPHSFDPGSNFRLQTSVVPEPGSLLLAFGCIALIGMRRRRLA